MSDRHLKLFNRTIIAAFPGQILEPALWVMRKECGENQ